MTTMAEVMVQAKLAAKTAGDGARPTPIIVSQTDLDGNVVQQWHEAAGMCGFAWVSVYADGRSKQAKELKQHGFTTSYQGGLELWGNQVYTYNGQSVEVKEAACQAFAKVLTGHGITAYANSRLD
jgi:hypothetical protein